GPVPLSFPARVVTYTVYAYNPFTQAVSLRITDTLPRYQGQDSYAFQYLGLSDQNTNPPTATTVITGGIVGWTTPVISGWDVYSFTFNAFLPPTMPIPPHYPSFDYYNTVNGSYGDIILPTYSSDQPNAIVREVTQIVVGKIVTP